MGEASSEGQGGDGTAASSRRLCSPVPPRYAPPVTFATRRRIYWLLFALALAVFIVGIVLSLPGLSGRPDSSFLADSGALEEGRILGLRFSSSIGARIGALLAAFLAVLLLGQILAMFRKTASPEIFFFSFWALSLAFECGKIAVFRLGAGGAPDASIEFASRLVLAGRYAGKLALFMSGLFAVGLRSERQGVYALALLAIGGAFAGAMPLDTGVYETSLVLRPGYPGIDDGIGFLIGTISFANYLRAASISGERGYVLAGLGLLLAVAGRFLLENSWNPLLFLPGALLVAFGSWILITKLHAWYLWQ